MAFQRVLVPIDGSEGSKRALDLAMKLADSDANVHFDVLYVVPIPRLSDSMATDVQKITDMMKEDGKKILAEAIDYMGDAGEQAEALMSSSVNPAAEIIKMTEKNTYDMIIIGNRGLSGRKEYAGSVSYKVLHASKTPVLIAK